ncbi:MULTISPECIES: hypothetical protein [Deinococcus]|uniref:Roadblock/LAMTOR2 domain-containing protein n=1 Tax=Deinococcus rufus TaxID=2136097 RepID=A0ABV7ZAQ5_9DEIO|nr:hypothetical protein [Deinococcus sp. AB2017081]WQE94344.1 hypothetical protein U2P90_13105 [Deinococcus sp. AB2017081]
MSGSGAIALIELNLVQACLGQITDAHQAIVYRHDDSDNVCHISTYLSHSSEAVVEAVQEIADELYGRLNFFQVDVKCHVVIGHHGVLQLTSGDCLFFLRKGFEILTSALGQ